MTPVDEKELNRLGRMLSKIDRLLTKTSPWREALQKAGLALGIGFMRGLRPDIERHYRQLGTPLTAAEQEHLRSMGIDPDTGRARNSRTKKRNVDNPQRSGGLFAFHG